MTITIVLLILLMLTIGCGIIAIVTHSENRHIALIEDLAGILKPGDETED